MRFGIDSLERSGTKTRGYEPIKNARSSTNCRKLGFRSDATGRYASWTDHAGRCPGADTAGIVQCNCSRWLEFVNGTSRRWNCPERIHSTYGENARKSNPHLRSHHPKLIDSIPSVGRGSHLPSKEEDRIQTFTIQIHSLYVACF